MSDANLVGFGFAVSFIVLAGFYVYLRECWSAEEPSKKPEAKSEEAMPAKFQDVA